MTSLPWLDIQGNPRNPTEMICRSLSGYKEPLYCLHWATLPNKAEDIERLHGNLQPVEAKLASTG